MAEMATRYMRTVQSTTPTLCGYVHGWNQIAARAVLRSYVPKVGRRRAAGREERGWGCWAKLIQGMKKDSQC